MIFFSFVNLSHPNQGPQIQGLLSWEESQNLEARLEEFAMQYL